MLMGLDDPVVWSEIIWIIASRAIRNGNKKWREKNRVKVGYLTENPPQIHFTMSFPQIGIADIILVITVAAQKDICPQGSTYPRNAVAIKVRRIVTPEFHVCFMKNEELYIFFPIWR